MKILDGIHQFYEVIVKLPTMDIMEQLNKLVVLKKKV